VASMRAAAVCLIVWRAAAFAWERKAPGRTRAPRPSSALWPEVGPAEGVDAAVDAVEPPGRAAVMHVRVSEAERAQLSHRDNAMLPGNESQ
jgi:hypothetical protein